MLLSLIFKLLLLVAVVGGIAVLYPRVLAGGQDVGLSDSSARGRRPVDRNDCEYRQQKGDYEECSSEVLSGADQLNRLQAC